MSQTAVANSTIAGAASYPLIAGALTAILAILGVVIPPFSIGALVVTQAMDISILSTVLSYVVVHYVPDSVGQHILALAKLAPEMQAMIPRTYHQPSDFPCAPPNPTPSNLSNAAISVIQAQGRLNNDTSGVLSNITAFPKG